jgi:hypothetical protein
MPILKTECRDESYCKLINDADHIKNYSHPSMEIVATNISGCNAKVNFQKNQEEAILELDEYFKQHNLKHPDQSILDYVREMRPCHRCSFEIFTLIIEHGCLLSKKRQFNLKLSPVNACLEEIRSDEAIRELLATEKLKFSHTFFEVRVIIWERFIKRKNN